jgi:DNA primase
MSEPRPQADFAVIRQCITMERILEHYGITGLKRNDDELRGRCPFHEQGKGERSFTVNTTKNIFQCFHCKAKGNVIDFVAKQEACSIREAGLKIWEWFNLNEETSSPTAPTLSEPRGEPQATGDRTAEELLAEISDKLSTIIKLLQRQ